MKKGNAFDVLLAADPDQPAPAASPVTAKNNRGKTPGFRHGVVCAAWHSGQILFLLHRHGESKNWALAVLTDKVLDDESGRDQALALLLSAMRDLPAPQLIDAPPMKESGTVLHFALLPSIALANQQFHFRTQPATANLFASNSYQLSVLNEATARYRSLAPVSAPPPSALPVVSSNNAPAAAAIAAPQAPEPVLMSARMIVLCGLPGSGKSSFSALLLKSLPGWIRISQDELGSRQACEQMVEEALASGQHVLVDRCNFNAQQRRTWIDLAAKWRCRRVDAVFLHVSVPECLRRVQERTNHPTLHPGAESVAVVNDFADKFRAPMPREGFTQVYRSSLFYMLSEGENAAELIETLGKS